MLRFGRRRRFLLPTRHPICWRHRAFLRVQPKSESRSIKPATILSGPLASAIHRFSTRENSILGTARPSRRCKSCACKLSGGDPRLVLGRLAQHIAASPHRLDVILTVRGAGELLAQLAHKNVNNFALRLVRAAIEVV